MSKSSPFYRWFSTAFFFGCGYIAIEYNEISAAFASGAHAMIASIEWIRFLAERAAKREIDRP